MTTKPQTNKISMLRFYFTFLLVVLTAMLQAQKEYSYVSDITFNSSEEFFGYTFRPNEEALDKGKQVEAIPLGTITLRMLPGYLYFKDSRGELTYNVNSINPVDYGYKVELMNARNPAEQGHLKIIMNKQNQVDALIFLESRKAKERIFYQMVIPARTAERDEKYFTDVKDINLNIPEYIFSKTIRPYFQSALEQVRVYPKDSVSFYFYEKIDSVGKKVVKNRYIRFKYMDKTTDGDEEIKEETFEIKKINLVELSGKKGKDKALDIVLKGGSKKSISIILDNMYVRAISFGNALYLLRDKTRNSPPAGKGQPDKD